MSKLPSSTLDSLLLVNSVVQIGTGLCSMFAPRFLANPQTWGVLKAEEWQRSQVIVGFRNFFGCGSIAMGLMSLLAFLRPHERPTISVLGGLSFYHLSVLAPLLVNDDFFQLPMGISHALLGLGFANFAMKEI